MAKHASTASAICTPLPLPKLERPASTPPKAPVQVNLGVVDEEESVPNSLNKRPHKRQDVREDMAASELHEGVGPSTIEEEEKEVGNVEEEEKEVGWTHLLPYVEVKLPDGRLTRQCRASDVCPLSESFIEKRKRMEDHLREKHGLIIKIPKRQVGRPTNQQIASRPSRSLPHPHAETWKKQAQKRALDKERKFQKNRNAYERLQHLRAERAWDELRDEFKTTSKDDYIDVWVKTKMANYMSTSAERIGKIEMHIQARGKNTVIYLILMFTCMTLANFVDTFFHLLGSPKTVVVQYCCLDF